jgi:hypothetical protein
LALDTPPLLADCDRPGAAPRRSLMIPFQEVMHEHAQHALQSKILLFAHVVDFLGDGREVQFT